MTRSVALQNPGLEAHLVLLLPGVGLDIHVERVVGVLQLLGADVTQHDAQGEEAEEAEHHEDVECLQLAVPISRGPVGWAGHVAALLNCSLPQFSQKRGHACGVRQDHPGFQGSTAGEPTSCTNFLKEKCDLKLKKYALAKSTLGHTI